MELMLLVGVWALAFGHMSISNSLSFKGNNARAFGAVLILVAAFGLKHLDKVMNANIPKFVAANEAFRSAYGLLGGALAIYGTAWLMTRVLPKLKIPSINISVKRKRHA